MKFYQRGREVEEKDINPQVRLLVMRKRTFLERTRRLWFWPAVLTAGALLYSLYTTGSIIQKGNERHQGWSMEAWETGLNPTGVTSAVPGGVVGNER